MASKRPRGTKRGYTPLALAAALLCSVPFAVTTAPANPPPSLPNCAAVAAQLLQNTDIIAAASAIQPASGLNSAYCKVNITVSDLAGPKGGYQPGQKQMINIGIGLPLSSADGGSGGVQGAWNGRNENLGGGGYAGSVGSTTSATNAGYLGSSTDTGHPASAGGTFALNPDNTLNWGLIRDFSYNGIHAQNVWSKKLAQMYYGSGPKYNYWNGCSTGGRQGHMQAQRYPKDFDGILAGAPAFNWDRFIPSEQWGEIAMYQEVGAPISAAKLNAVRQAAIAACDPLDGITDGVIQDPRACTYSATQFVCTGSFGDPANCLTPQEAQAVDKIWNGPPGPHAGQRLWFGLERGTNFSGLDGTNPFSISSQWFQYWVYRNPSFDWHTITEQSFASAFKDSELMFHDVIGTDDPDLTEFKAHGGKMIMYHGLADFLIFPRGSYNYYNRVAAREGGVKETQKFYRFFPYPSNTHCSADPSFPNAPQINGTDLFNALVNWVEHGVAPDSLVGYNNQSHASATVSRPICKYPDTLVYNGSGSTNEASNFHCQVNTTDELMNAEKVLPDPGATAGHDHDHDRS